MEALEVWENCFLACMQWSIKQICIEPAFMYGDELVRRTQSDL